MVRELKELLVFFNGAVPIKRRGGWMEDGGGETWRQPCPTWDLTGPCCAFILSKPDFARAGQIRPDQTTREWRCCWFGFWRVESGSSVLYDQRVSQD